MKVSVLKVSILIVTTSLAACKSDDNPATSPLSYPYQQVYSGECKNTPQPASCTFELGYNSGYQDGYDEGFDEGEDYAYDDAYWRGRNDGYNSGYDDGYDDGYSDGYYSSSDADDATDTNFSAMTSDANKKIVKNAADRLTKEYGLASDKAVAVASALRVWAVAGVERGYTTPQDVSQTFQKVFGVDLKDAMAAVKSFSVGDTGGMKDITNRSASALGLKPHQAKKFIKGMYSKALTDIGYDAESIDW
jgi:hypothetical protein